MTKNILVWWLDEEISTFLNANMPQKLPEYIAGEVRGRYGRAGRGRLWVPEDIDCKEIGWDDQSPICELISLKSAGGVVFHKKDLEKVMFLPGFITDTNCMLIDSEK